MDAELETAKEPSAYARPPSTADPPTVHPDRDAEQPHEHEALGEKGRAPRTPKRRRKHLPGSGKVPIEDVRRLEDSELGPTIEALRKSIHVLPTLPAEPKKPPKQRRPSLNELRAEVERINHRHMLQDLWEGDVGPLVRCVDYPEHVCEGGYVRRPTAEFRERVEPRCIDHPPAYRFDQEDDAADRGVSMMDDFLARLRGPPEDD